MENVPNPNPLLADTSNEISERDRSGNSTESTSTFMPDSHKLSTTCTKTTAKVVQEATETAGEIRHNQSSSECCESNNSGQVEGAPDKQEKIDTPTKTHIPGTSENKNQTELEESPSQSATPVDESEGNSGPLPNFRVEGSGSDSLITVAVASLTSAVPVSTNSPCISGEGPGSGPISIQSSEDMKLSLLSWYSEPDDSSRIHGDSSLASCCGESSTAEHFQNNSNGLAMTRSLVEHNGSDEKENKTPEPTCGPICNSNSKVAEIRSCNGESKMPIDRHEKHNGIKHRSSSAQSRIKMHVQRFETKSTDSPIQKSCHKKPTDSCNSESRNGRPECSRCTRRSKSGTTTPATGLKQESRSRTPSNRRVIQSSKSSTELKKPIKSILKTDSRGSGGSGSDNRSSMDSLASAEIASTTFHQHGIMTRSDSSTRAKFNLNHQTFNDRDRYLPEGKMVAKLKRIEKYATLRVRKTPKPKADLSDSDVKVGYSESIDLMTKSMSVLEKASPRGERLPHSSSLSANSTLRRQGSLRTKSNTSVWEPCTTRTTALRLQKMQEKLGTTGQHTSTHLGSKDSVNHSFHSTNTSIISQGSLKTSSTLAKDKIHHVGAKVFSKLSSAMGQTASSNQKRLKQDKAIQTDLLLQLQYAASNENPLNRKSLSPVPSIDLRADGVDQIRQLEKLANRYRNTALRFQSEYEKSEAEKLELAKLLQETQTESNEMIEFLQAEKSTLIECLAEVENENRPVEIKDSPSPSLVRLPKQHSQESESLLDHTESNSTSMIQDLTTKIQEGAKSIRHTRKTITSLTDSLLMKYKVPPELLTSFVIPKSSSEMPQSTDPELVKSLLLPLISTLTNFLYIPLPEINLSLIEENSISPSVHLKVDQPKMSNMELQPDTPFLSNSTSLQNLHHTKVEYKATEVDFNDKIYFKDCKLLQDEISQLNAAIERLILVIRIIVIHCEKKVTTVASSILQCLNSMEDDNDVNTLEVPKGQNVF